MVTNRDGPAPMCHFCERRFSTDYGSDADGFHCQAFPDGIPEAILNLSADHRAPYRGDGGLRFLPQRTAPPDEYWDLVFEPVLA